MQVVKRYELIEFLFGEQTSRMEGLIGGRLQGWAEAFEGWLKEREREYGRNILSISRCAWRDFLGFTQKPPWEALEADVQDWVTALVTRGLRPSTINQRLTALTKFYNYCQEMEVDGGEVADPAGQIPRLTQRKYSNSAYLGYAEIEALLGAIDHETSLLGKRDYAMILMLLTTSLKAKEIRELQWGMIRQDRQGACVQTERGEVVPLNSAVWQASMDFEAEAGRLEKLKEDSYLFPAVKESLLAIPCGEAEDWKEDQPMSAALLKFTLKRYAKAAGLEAEKVTCHSLRNSAAVLRLQAGDEAEEVQSFLRRASLNKTQDYLDKLAEQATCAEIKAEREIKPIERGPRRAEPGNQQALKHGFYASKKDPKDGLEGVIEKFEIVLDRAFELAKEAENTEELLRMLDVLGMAATRTGSLRRILKNVEGDEIDEWAKARDEVIAQLTKEWDLKSVISSTPDK